MSFPPNPIRKDYDDAETHLAEDATLLDQSASRPRQGSVHFDFNPISLSLSGVETGSGAGNQSRIGLGNGIALVVGLQLGSE